MMPASPPRAPSFATPLPQSSRSDILVWRFPKPYHQYVLTGRSRAAWHTSFVIPQLNLLLDAGLCINKLRPKHIFLTHGHSDHTLLSPAFVKREDPPDIFCPAEMQNAFDDFITANRLLNLGGLVGLEQADQVNDEEQDTPVGTDDDDDVGSSRKRSKDSTSGGLLGTHVTYGVRHGDVVPLRRLKGISASVFNCDHTVPCVGYVFHSTTQRLKPEYKALAGPEIAHLRKSGVEISAAHNTPIFAFLGDTTALTLASEPEWLRNGIPVIITECSFLYSEHRARAEKTKHTLWADLEPVVRKWPKTTFVLTHFSLRYKESEISTFFEDMVNPPENIVVWADPEGWNELS